MKDNKDLHVGQLTNAHVYNVLKRYESLEQKASDSKLSSLSSQYRQRHFFWV